MNGSVFVGDNVVFLLSAGILFFAVILIVMAANRILTERKEAAGDKSEPSHPVAGNESKLATEDKLLQRFARFTTPVKEDEINETRIRLSRAGYRRPSAIRIFHMSRAACGLGFTLLGAILLPLLLGSFPLPIMFAMIVFVFLLGFTMPSLVLDSQISRRRQTAEQGFPDTLDLLLVCIEAGQGFDQASRRIARELKSSNKVLAEEFAIVNDELWAGRDRAAVFRAFAQRLDVSDISAFVTVLRQADQFGVSIADSIRVYAADMRFKRVMRAEEKANKMPLKLALASMLCTVPPTMMIMIGPSLLEIMRSFSQAGGG
jgi:tight adherence protein C